MPGPRRSQFLGRTGVRLAAWSAGLCAGMLSACGAGSGTRPASMTDTVESFGRLELVTYRRVSRGPETVASG